MAIHHSTPPFRGGERPRLPSAQVGPVTQAIRAMRAAEPVSHSGFAGQFTHGIRALSRTEVENLVEGLIDLLDGWDGDADCEATALERSGRGFRSSGYDDAEDGHDAEANTDDNGIADFHALGEQGFPGYGGCL
ncbi:hypothetical protein [Methylobacterium sp. J-077]|uniref:hypothetical protein n=1 Tax=Methylobacterium sp. J-077 TaxID=2836656 RepID=UPI001FB90540|nr:hypothetical protein [Methylobacterium sp. J-077]MCJ2126657.1 hypothetical protein [Methylobacterium sp. J-077]